MTLLSVCVLAFLLVESEAGLLAENGRVSTDCSAKQKFKVPQIQRKQKRSYIGIRVVLQDSGHPLEVQEMHEMHSYV